MDECAQCGQEVPDDQGLLCDGCGLFICNECLQKENPDLDVELESDMLICPDCREQIEEQ